MFSAFGGIGIPTQDEYNRLFGNGDGTTIGPAAPAPRTAADLAALIRQNNGAYYVWTTNVNTSAELNIAKRNPLTFTVTPVADDPGTYKIALSAVASLLPGTTPKPTTTTGNVVASNSIGAPAPSSSLGSYTPYLVLGVGAVVLLSILKR